MSAVNSIQRDLMALARGWGTQEIDPVRLRQLLQLCHPDKHGGSVLANTVTQWLNDLRREVSA